MTVRANVLVTVVAIVTHALVGVAAADAALDEARAPGTGGVDSGLVAWMAIAHWLWLGSAVWVSWEWYSQHSTRSRAWLALAWAIPIWNLVAPFPIVRDLAATGNSTTWRLAAVAWWVLWLAIVPAVVAAPLLDSAGTAAAASFGVAAGAQLATALALILFTAIAWRAVRRNALQEPAGWS